MSNQPPPQFPAGFQHSPTLIPSAAVAAAGEAPPVAPAAAYDVPSFVPPPVATAIPAESIDRLRRGDRPGVIVPLAVTSIIVSLLSGLFGLVLLVYGLGFYFVTLASSAPTTWSAAGSGPPAAVAFPGGTPFRMTPDARQALVLTLTRAHPIDDPRRRAQLDALLAAAGRRVGASALESGTMPDSRDGEPGPDYFVTARGRLEVFNDRAVFFPSDGSDTIRISAPPPGATQPGVTSDVTADDEDPGSDVDGDGSDPTSRAASPATGGAAGATPAIGTLTPAEVEAVVGQAQSLAGSKLNPQQVAALRSVISAPAQEFVAPDASQPAVLSCLIQPNGTALVHFAHGSFLVLGPRGNVAGRFSPAANQPTPSLSPWSVALFITTAAVSIFLAVLLLVAGILTLGRSPGGRRLHLVYACLKIPAALAGGFAIAHVMYELSSGPSAGGQPSGTAARGAASVLMAVAPTLLACIYPVVLLAVLNTKSVRDYFRSIAAAG